MAGDGNKVGEVYVEIKATGAENVAREVQKAQAMATALPMGRGSGGAARLLGAAANTAGGGLGFTNDPAVTNSFPTPNSSLLAPQKVAVDTEALKHQARVIELELNKAFDNLGKTVETTTGKKKTLRQEMVSFRQGIMGTVAIIGSFATAIAAGIQGLIGFKNASADVSNALRDIDEGLKIVTTTGKSNYETLIDSSNEYHQQIMRQHAAEQESLTELGNAILSNSKIRIDVSTDGVKAEIGDSDELAAKKAQNEQTLERNKKKAITAEINHADLRTRNIEREMKLSQAASEEEKLNLKRKFELEDARRNQAKPEEGKKLDKELTDLYAKEERLINEKYDREISKARETKKLKDYNAEAEASIAADRKAEMAELDGAARIRKQRDFDIEDLQKKKSVTEDADTRRMIDNQIAAREKIANAELSIEQKKQAEKDALKKEADARALEQAKQAANAQAQAIGDAYSKATADIMANFANQQSQSIEELAQYVKLIAEGVGR